MGSCFDFTSTAGRFGFSCNLRIKNGSQTLVAIKLLPVPFIIRNVSFILDIENYLIVDYATQTIYKTSDKVVYLQNDSCLFESEFIQLAEESCEYFVIFNKKNHVQCRPVMLQLLMLPDYVLVDQTLIIYNSNFFLTSTCSIDDAADNNHLYPKIFILSCKCEHFINNQGGKVSIRLHINSEKECVKKFNVSIQMEMRHYDDLIGDLVSTDSSYKMEMGSMHDHVRASNGESLARRFSYVLQNSQILIGRANKAVSFAEKAVDLADPFSLFSMLPSILQKILYAAFVVFICILAVFLLPAACRVFANFASSLNKLKSYSMDNTRRLNQMIPMRSTDVRGYSNDYKFSQQCFV